METSTVLITLIGMGLVFVGILLLWGVMEWLVRATSERQPIETEMQAETPEPGAMLEQKRAVAAAAVSVVLAMQRKETAALVLNNLADTHNWQTVMRANQLNSVCQFSLRKPQGKSS